MSDQPASRPIPAEVEWCCFCGEAVVSTQAVAYFCHGSDEGPVYLPAHRSCADDADKATKEAE